MILDTSTAKIEPLRYFFHLTPLQIPIKLATNFNISNELCYKKCRTLNIPLQTLNDWKKCDNPENWRIQIYNLLKTMTEDEIIERKILL